MKAESRINQEIYRCNDSYKAAYLMLHGAKIEEVQIRKLVDKKVKKKHYHHQWFFLLTNVSPRHKELAIQGRAVCNIDDLKCMRTKIKRLIRKAKPIENTTFFNSKTLATAS